MSRAIPVFEREQRKTYELQRGNPRRRMLNKHWKQDPPKSDDKHPNLFSMITKNNYIIGVNHQSWTIHSSKKGMQETYSVRRIFRRNNGKPRTTYRQPIREKGNTMQTESYSNSKTEQNEFKPRNEFHKPISNKVSQGQKMETLQMYLEELC